MTQVYSAELTLEDVLKNNSLIKDILETAVKKELKQREN